jgi:fumarylacetoacetate (FAA) hydrolase family protein
MRDSITAGIATAVAMVVAELSPQRGGTQPILRPFDAVVGVAVGVTAAWIRLSRRVSTQARNDDDSAKAIPRPGRIGREQRSLESSERDFGSEVLFHGDSC